jgi:hypothetical protein
MTTGPLAWSRDAQGRMVLVRVEEGPDLGVCENCGDDLARYTLALCLDCVESLRGGA